MKDERELLQKLRAAGVEPMDDEEMDRAAGWALTQAAGTGDSDLEGRAVVAALEARAKLAEVREWAALLNEDEHGEAYAGRLLEILDKEPEP